ncbi:MAG: hypothetical protein ACLP7I_12165 [Limisphaerales bacterium]
MTEDTKIILRELATVEAGIAMIIEQQDAILEHFDLKESNVLASKQAARRYNEAIGGIKKRLQEKGVTAEI